MLIGTLTVVILSAAPLQTLAGDAVRQYEDAVRLVQASRFKEAIQTLNGIAATYPRVPEVFATRCSAQLGAGMSPGAEADCRYALTLKPTLSMAMYALAVAEDNQGKSNEAIAHYRDYAARADADAGLKAQSLTRADTLSRPQALAVAAPPPPAAVAPPPGQPAANVAGPRGTIIIYRNHYFQRGDWQVTLLVDDQVVGDIQHDQFVEVQLPAGEHVVEACIGGVRYRHHGGFPTLHIDTSNGGFDARLGSTGESADRLRGITVPVDVQANGQTYVNFDTHGNSVYLANQSASTGYEEVTRDCRKAYTKRF
jgi:tetratricopeptide (TPR) repeat protein